MDFFPLSPKFWKVSHDWKVPILDPPPTKHAGFWAWIPNEFSSNWSFFWEEWTISVVCDYVSLQDGQACFKRRLKHVLNVAFFCVRKNSFKPKPHVWREISPILSLSPMCPAHTELNIFLARCKAVRVFLGKNMPWKNAGSISAICALWIMTLVWSKTQMSTGGLLFKASVDIFPRI